MNCYSLKQGKCLHTKGHITVKANDIKFDDMTFNGSAKQLITHSFQSHYMQIHNGNTMLK